MRDFLLALLLGLTVSLSSLATESLTVPTVPLGELPHEARVTLQLIDRGGPFPYRRDGVVFGNREQRLPPKPRGAYREYTVPTPSASGRGARRIIAAESGERYYTADHYRSFSRIRE